MSVVVATIGFCGISKRAALINSDRQATTARLHFLFAAMPVPPTAAAARASGTLARGTPLSGRSSDSMGKAAPVATGAAALREVIA